MHKAVFTRQVLACQLGAEVAVTLAHHLQYLLAYGIGNLAVQGTPRRRARNRTS